MDVNAEASLLSKGKTKYIRKQYRSVQHTRTASPTAASSIPGFESLILVIILSNMVRLMAVSIRRVGKNGAKTQYRTYGEKYYILIASP